MRIRTCTGPGEGSGTSASRMTSGGPNSRTRMAFIGHLPARGVTCWDAGHPRAVSRAGEAVHWNPDTTPEVVHGRERQQGDDGGAAGAGGGDPGGRRGPADRPAVGEGNAAGHHKVRPQGAPEGRGGGGGSRGERRRHGRRGGGEGGGAPRHREGSGEGVAGGGS